MALYGETMPPLTDPPNVSHEHYRVEPEFDYTTPIMVQFGISIGGWVLLFALGVLIQQLIVRKCPKCVKKCLKCCEEREYEDDYMTSRSVVASGNSYYQRTSSYDKAIDAAGLEMAYGSTDLNIPSSSENYYTGRRGHYRVDSLDGGSILAAQQDAMMRNIFNVHSHHQSSIAQSNLTNNNNYNDNNENQNRSPQPSREEAWRGSQVEKSGGGYSSHRTSNEGSGSGLVRAATAERLIRLSATYSNLSPNAAILEDLRRRDEMLANQYSLYDLQSESFRRSSVPPPSEKSSESVVKSQ